jgi:hypothetical protein
MEKEINEKIIKKGIKIENDLKDPKLKVILRTASTGPVKVESGGLRMPVDLRFYPPGKGNQPLYSQCIDPIKYLDRSKIFYDITATVDRCFLYSFMRALIDTEFSDIVKIPANSFGLESVFLKMLPNEDDFMEITPGQVKTKAKGRVSVDFSPPFTFDCDANIGLSLEKDRPHFSLASYSDQFGNFFTRNLQGTMLGAPPTMASYNIIVTVDNIFNIDASSAPWVPQALIEFVASVLKDTLFHRNPVPFKLPGICIDHGSNRFLF